MKVRQVLRRLLEAGWQQVRVRGSHRQLAHPSRPGVVTISGNESRDMPTGLLKSVEKQSGVRLTGGDRS